MVLAASPMLDLPQHKKENFSILDYLGIEMTEDCLVCNGRSDSFAHARIMSRYDIEYFRCSDCQFVQTETPYWLDEAYSSAIASTDVGLISRNEQQACTVDRLLRFAIPRAQSSIDYGGGYGMFTRMMRDRGHHFSHYDPYCENLFATGFESSPGQEHYDVLTAFEVFEHMSNPHHDLRQIDSFAEHWIVSTVLVPDPAPLPDQWWYYVLEGGQHIALWTKRALQSIASQYQRKLITRGRGIHVFAGGSVSSFRCRQVLRKRLVRVFDGLGKRESLLSADFQKATADARRNAA